MVHSTILKRWMGTRMGIVVSGRASDTPKDNQAVIWLKVIKKGINSLSEIVFYPFFLLKCKRDSVYNYLLLFSNKRVAPTSLSDPKYVSPGGWALIHLVPLFQKTYHLQSLHLTVKSTNKVIHCPGGWAVNHLKPLFWKHA